MSKVKGGTIKSRIDFIKENYGEEGLNLLLSAFSKEDQKILTGILLYSSWYSFELYEHLDKVIHEKLAPVDKKIYEKLGAYSARVHLNSIYKFYLKNNDPLAFCKGFNNIFRSYYDSGKVEIEEVSPNQVMFRIYDFASPSRQDCDSNVGYIREALSLCGAKNPRVFETKCRVKGDNFCEIAASWE
ncbi:MAG: hypothetical protein PHV06_02830 [bacterium]|nr:hypothetical protein [bacterium]